MLILFVLVLQINKQWNMIKHYLVIWQTQSPKLKKNIYKTSQGKISQIVFQTETTYYLNVDLKSPKTTKHANQTSTCHNPQDSGIWPNRIENDYRPYKILEKQRRKGNNFLGICNETTGSKSNKSRQTSNKGGKDRLRFYWRNFIDVIKSPAAFTH